MPCKSDGQACGIVSKDVDGLVKEHKFVRGVVARTTWAA
jgi:hypothetical protein